MMRILHRGGVEPLCDPPSLEYGYELNATLSLPDDTGWLQGTGGKAVKILDPHRLRLPDDRPYAFILLTRDSREQAKSHIKFIKALGVPVFGNARSKIEQSLRRDLPLVRTLLASYSNARLLSMTFEDLIEDPLGSCRQLDDFLQRQDFDMLTAAQCVMQRSPKCLPYLLEAQQVA